MKECFKDHFSTNSGVLKDPWLLPFKAIIQRRFSFIDKRLALLTREGSRSLSEFSVYHLIFGLHWDSGSWIFREWAPGARSIHLIGDMTDWKIDPRYALERRAGSGIWEGRFNGDFFHHMDHYRMKLTWEDGEGDRIPSAATRVVQDPETLIFNAQVWKPDHCYQWKNKGFKPEDAPLLIYEAHVGMATEEWKVGGYAEFDATVLERIKAAGYNTVLLMAIQEHPYYGSLGYHVTNFYAPCSRFGTPEELKSLVDRAHGLGLRVMIDLVHSHAARNEVEGLSRFDGSLDQFFYPGDAGYHSQWDSRCFDYSRPAVLRFLLSNCRYWLEEFCIDGFRFDGVTSMIFKDHGLNRAFVSYEDYFNNNVDLNALAYLFLANSLIHEVMPSAITIAEDVSGYPGIAAPIPEGGFGFDYRYAMGIPDFWIRLLKEYRDEGWPLQQLWYELNSRREEEKTISYAESHDQAIVGDQTLMMRLMGESIYTGMKVVDPCPMVTFRAVSLHKMIRLITLATAGNGYLNFMGNEFGHPEWIDFPSQKNNWSYHYARRQWSLRDNPDLYFSKLGNFDIHMIKLARTSQFLGSGKAELLHLHQEDRVIAFRRDTLIFVFNLNDSASFTDYAFQAPPGKYVMILNTDAVDFGGQGRLVHDQVHFTLPEVSSSALENEGKQWLSLYLPTRTGIVLTLEKD